jgi:anti-sigma B factor antagonist
MARKGVNHVAMGPSDAPLLVCSRSNQGWTVVEVHGEIDVATAPWLRDGLAQAAQVIADLSKVTFCDATGLGVLVHAHVQARRLGGRLRVVCANGLVRRLIAITRSTHTLMVYAGLDEALAGDQGYV